MWTLARVGLVIVGLGFSGCAWFRSPPEAGVTTGATVVYNGGPGGELFSVCDKGNLVYLTKSQPAVAVIKDGCNPNAQDATLAQVAAIQRLADRPNPPPFTIPSPLPVLVVPDPHAPKVAAVEREPIVVHVQPSVIQSAPPTVIQSAPPIVTCPACPVAPHVSRSTKQTASKAAVVTQVDPNTASVADLERLPGVTKQVADGITKGRPYRTLHELVEKKALTEADLQALKPYLVIR